ncbi:hypothetical protein CRUP_004363, partial [Coryphaenoides rupestris]
VLDLSLTGSQLSVSRRPSSASPGKYFSRSVSVSVATEGKGKRNTLSDASFGISRSVKNLRRSNSTTQVNQQANVSLSEEPADDFLAVFDGSSDGRRKLASLSKASPDRTTWNILVWAPVTVSPPTPLHQGLHMDDQPRVFPPASSTRSTGSVDSQTGMKRREHGLTLAANFTANNRSNKGAVGNSVTTILHNNYSEKPLTPKSSNQKPTFNNILKATGNDEASLEHGSVTKSQKNFASAASPTSNNRPSPAAAEVVAGAGGTPTAAGAGPQHGSPGPGRRREVTEEEAERFIQQVNQAVVTIQRWYRHHAQRSRSCSQAALRRLLATKKEEWEQRVEMDKSPEVQQHHHPQQKRRKEEERKRVREEKARLARLSAIQELQQKRAQQATEAQQTVDQELEGFRRSGRVGRKKPAKTLLVNNSPSSPCKNGPASPTDVKARNTDSNANMVAEVCEVTGFRAISPALSNRRGSQCSQDQRQAVPSSRTPSKTTLHDLLDTLKLLEEEPEKLSDPGKAYHRDKYAWIDEDGDSTSLTTDNLERHGQLSRQAALPDGGALLSEAKLQSIMSFLDEMERSEQERPRSVTSGSHREVGLSEEERAGGVEQASATAAEVTGSLMRLKLDLDEKRRTVNMLQAALAQQRELTVRHLIDDKKTLSERCEAVVAELKQVDHKYTKKIAQMQEQHDMEIKKLKELMSATEKPEIQKLISKHKQELKRLRAAHEAELQGSDERAAQRYVRQCQELREQLERDKEEQCHREKEAVKQRQRAELEDLRRQLEDNSSLAGHALREELDKTREEQERRHQVEMRALRERLDIEKQTWEENYMKKEEAWLLSRERELKEEVRHGRDKEIESAIQRLEEETSGAREECERAAENRVKRVRDKYELELRDLEHSERAAVEKQQQLRKVQVETEGELIRLQGLLRQRDQEMEAVVQSRDKLAEERRRLAEVIRQEFAERLVATEEENRRMKVEVSEVRARLRLEVERITREKEAELAEAALKRAEHLEALWEQQRRQLLEK